MLLQQKRVWEVIQLPGADNKGRFISVSIPPDSMQVQSLGTTPDGKPKLLSSSLFRLFFTVEGKQLMCN